MAKPPTPNTTKQRRRCDATWALPGDDTQACDAERAMWGPLDPSLEFMASGISGLVQICEPHQQALDAIQRLDASDINQDSTLWPLYWAATTQDHPSPGVQAVQWFVADVNAARLRHIDGWQTETQTLIDEHGVDTVEAHMATIRQGHPSTTMLADVAVAEQLMVAKMVSDAIATREGLA